jgi:hypothetical protein
MIDVNYWAILVAGIFSIVIGGLWYGPLFGKQWMALVGITPESMKSMKMTPMQAMAGGFVVGLLTVFVLAHHMAFAGAYLESSGYELALMSAFWIWLGFFLPVNIGVVLWEGKSWKLFFLTTSYFLVNLVVSALILAYWL